jgi:hypothetical protein
MPTKCPKFKCDTVSVSFSACRCCSVVVSSKEERKRKKRVWRQFCECLSGAAAHLPTAVSQLLLEALLIADLRSELNTHLAPWALFTLSSSGNDATATSFPLSKHTGGGDTTPAFSGWRIYLQFMWEVALPPSPVEFSSHCHCYKLSLSWLLGVCCHFCLLRPACLFTVP